MESSIQPNLFIKRGYTPGKIKRKKHVGFLDPNPEEIMIDNSLLRDYLKDMGSDWVIEIRNVLRELD